ncbi:GNAT family N-acetyltransferase [Serinibacter arcticus]|uniref:Enhanced intracellular survival protein n=1 Tax=Serinibacter arcticus TaxID=1655435 RepID=A0A4Z1E3X7_9MICO|nr:GNAT family N-acetyltransferase [Serinibacter arcticus]TGO05173.1 Enhanced intracellular survival protein [Serinibacter arcticus]
MPEQPRHSQHATTSLDARTVPLDPASTRTLADAGLTYRAVDTDGDDFVSYVQAVNRGFLGERSKPEAVEAWRETIGDRRPVGVFDGGSPEPHLPVATVNAWVDELTVDVDRLLPMWAVSAVTVSATHRRRGIARAMLEGELRAAADAGLPIAGLTVSEATIYGRYGFAPVATATSWTVKTHRAGWIGPRPGGRLDPIERELAQQDLAALHDVVRRGRPGEVAATPSYWRSTAGLTPGQTDGGKVRAVRYTDESGQVRGVLAYQLENRDDGAATLTVRALAADGPDAYAALWRFALEHDLVDTVRATERSADEPLRWLLADPRAAEVTERDHHWLRILDVARCLESRTYRAPGAVTFDVVDPLGFAAGRWTLTVAEGGAGVVTRDGAGDGEGAVVTLGVAELSALLLGGVRATTLRAAGRLATDAATAAWLDATFAPVAAPQLSLWY